MIKITPETKLDGLAQKLKELSHQLAVIYDISMDLGIKADWYDLLDPEWGGPPTQRELKKTAQDLREIYLNIVLITGLDPCEQFESIDKTAPPYSEYGTLSN